MKFNQIIRPGRCTPDFSATARRLSAGIAATLLMCGISGAAHASDIGVLRIKNNSNATQNFIVIDDYFRCMDFPLPKKDEVRTTITVPPNGHTDTQFARDGSCDPEGRFLIMALDRKTGQAMGNAIAFEASGDANLWRIWEAESPTPHAIGPKSLGKEYTTGKLTYELDTYLPGYELGTAIGEWVRACGGDQGCTREISSSVVNTVSREESTSKETTEAFSVTVSSGFSFPGGEAGAEFSASTETTTGEALTLANSGETGTVSTCTTQNDMKEYQINSVWQWAVGAYVGQDKIVTTTCLMTCTQTAAAPTYLPDDPRALEACLIKKTDETVQAAFEQATREQEANRAKAKADAAAAAAKAKAAQDRAASCVTFYKGANGSGEAAMVCGTDQPGWTGTSVDYANLGTPGTSSHHYGVVSFRCAPGVGYVQFMNGNATPMPRHNESCKGGGVVTPVPWVKANATGAGIYLKPQKCCGE